MKRSGCTSRIFSCVQKSRYLQQTQSLDVIWLFCCIILFQNKSFGNTGGQMNKPAEKYQDADDARNVAILRERLTAEVEGLRESLAVWIEENTQRAIDAAISIAMLETAFDRYIELLGENDAFELIQSAFRRRGTR